LYIFATLREKEKGFPQRLERHRENSGITLSRLCERFKSKQSVKNLNSKRAESYDFQLVFLLA
jgi:molybdopterin converting factor small subunit